MTTEKKTPTALQAQIIRLWADGMKSAEIAAKLSCSIESVRLVRKTPIFKEMCNERRREQVFDGVPLAIKRLLDILRDDSQKGSDHIAAAREILERSRLFDSMDAANKEVKINIEYVGKATDNGDSEI